MQIISTVHHCLYFKHNKLKYLFGLTPTLLLDPSALRKTNPDHILLPSHPYLPAPSLFVWNLQALPLLKTRSILFSDPLTRRRLEHLMNDEPGLNPQDFRWDFFQQYQIDEQIIIKVLCEQKIPKPLGVEPYGIGFNASPERLTLVVPERGRSILFIHGSEVMILDPAENIQQLLQYYGIPLSAIKAVILTTPSALNVFELLMKLAQVRVITEESIYRQLKRRLKTYLLWDQEMLMTKLRGKVLCSPEKSQHLGPISFSYHSNQNSEIEYWDIRFGLKLVRVYSSTLDHFPSEIINLAELEYFIAYGIEDEVKKHLEKSPEVYRKKVIFNRIDKKYNHKYFVTLNPNAELLTVTAHPHVQGQLLKRRPSLAFQFREKDLNGCLSAKALKDKEVFNANGRIVYVRQGYVRDQLNQLQGIGGCILNQSSVIGGGGSTHNVRGQDECFLLPRKIAIRPELKRYC